MTLDFLSLYNECAGQPWSMFDNDAESNEDFESSMKISINKAISVLWNKKAWNFRRRKTSFKVRPGKETYVLPEGNIYKDTIASVQRFYVFLDGEFLDYKDDYIVSDLNEEPGKPTEFYIEDDLIKLYPVPDKEYKLDIYYLPIAYGLNANDEDIYELKEDDDRINIPERYEAVFRNCLISLAMIYAIADDSDENHSGYLRQYNDALSVLDDYCNRGMFERDIVW